MGSLASRPKVPRIQQQPQIIYVTNPVTTLSNNPSTDTPVSQNDSNDSVTAAELRAQNLLTRNRGRFGTVTTSFRGLLSAVNNSARSKTLLGE